MKEYEEPNKDKVKIGDFLYTDNNGKIIQLPIIEINRDKRKLCNSRE